MVCPSWDIQTSTKNHSFPKKTGAKSQVFKDRLFPYPKWEHRIKYFSSVSSAWNAVSFHLAVTLNSLKVKPSHFLHMKLFLYSLGILKKQELEHQLFNISHLALALAFGVPADLIDSSALLLGFMNWNLLLDIEFFLQVINTAACTWAELRSYEVKRSMLTPRAISGSWRILPEAAGPHCLCWLQSREVSASSPRVLLNPDAAMNLQEIRFLL